MQPTIKRSYCLYVFPFYVKGKKEKITVPHVYNFRSLTPTYANDGDKYDSDGHVRLEATQRLRQL